jgi:hypothetical protein
VTRALETLEKKTFHEDFWNKRVFVFVVESVALHPRSPFHAFTSRALSLRSLFFRVRLHSATVGMGSFGSRI